MKKSRTSSFVHLAAAAFVLAGLAGVLPAAQDQSPQNDPPKKDPATRDARLLEGVGPKPRTPGKGPPRRAVDEPAKLQEPTLEPFSTGSDIGDQNPLLLLGSRMVHVRRRLRARDMAETTQAVQRRIVADLDEIIERLARQQGDSRRQQSQRKQDPGSKKPGKAGKKAAHNSADSQGQGGTAQRQSESVRRAFGEIWGHLPERYRRQMQSVGAVEFLPKYRKLIEDYYQRLAEDR